MIENATSTPLSQYSAEDLAAFLAEQQSAHAALVAAPSSLNLTRGKPSSAQLDLSNALLDGPDGFVTADGTDTRNYGGLTGITELRDIFADLLGVPTAQLIAGGNSSLTMMQTQLVNLLLHGGVDSPRPWAQEDKITFICPVPGYDRHFALTASLGIEMVTVPMLDDGPDVDAIEALVKDDPSVKGMWLVPTYANPTGAVCTQAVAARLAAMPTAAPDFTIFWDNAYALHHLTSDEAKSADIVSLCTASGHPNRAVVFASTSKITFAGAGVAFLASSPANVDLYVKHLGMATIGPDKVNQLRHAQFFGDAQGVRDHMVKHAEILAPKFEAVQRILGERLGAFDVATWSDPKGGYFVNLDVVDGTATRVVALAKEAGISLTPAGASFPHGDDPRDRNIRLAPSVPPLAEVEESMDAVATCVLLAAAEKYSR